jgi:acyl carrier protein
MKRVDFINGLKEALEVENSVQVTENDDLKSFENFSSLSVLSIIAFIDENFSKTIKYSDFRNVNSIKELMILIGTDNFED